MAAAQASVPNSMRSGRTACTAPASRAAPSMLSSWVPRPDTLAPIAIRQAARSAISGSRAALRIVVGRSARTAASSRFSVAPTEGSGSRMSAPRRPAGAVAWIIAAVERHRRAHGAEAGEVEVDGAPADGVAAGQRQARLAAARQQRAEQQHRGAHARHQIAVDAAAAAVRSAEIVTDKPAEVDDQCISQPRRCSNDDKHRDVEIGRHVAQGDEMRRQQRRHHQRQHGVLRAADRIGADERPAAADDQRCRRCRAATRELRREERRSWRNDKARCVDSATVAAL